MASDKKGTGAAGGAAAEEKASKSNGAYFVSPHPDGGWQVKKANAQKALKRFKTKAEAEAYAKQVASNQGTTVVRQKKDGKIQKKRRGPRGARTPIQQNVVSSLSRTSFQSLMVSWASSSSMIWMANPAWTTAQSPTWASTIERLALRVTPPKSTSPISPSIATIFPGMARHISLTPTLS